MNKKEIMCEAYEETTKSTKQLIEDCIQEANTLPKSVAPEKENLDIIKHLIKRLAIHQLLLEKEANKTNCWLLILSIISTIATVISLVNVFK